ncbi:hypothetical protein SAMN05216228_1006102 [Rhizobium tibeticum]|uniref:SH3b domain-containing protein n=1 Tax=Rhizobium tibeticum TaxID=501024 RepID=A0A1H8IEZ2_9HYPH|nr:hypothetical protein [Rhizobium tibeticum]SEH70654.1 hypothetical protein RTCCBAU85039_1891 [Rhizobium tibeticum]SEN66795.1 hypothetical protein SAMN05216228_1006102 [Rhizobium tibeticum]
MKKLAALIASASMFATSAAATPAVATATVNFRSGPGTGYGSFGNIQEGSPLDVSECDASGAWCTVKFLGRDGFVNGKYINRTEPDTPPWPRSFMPGNSATLTLFQPQFTDWPAFTELKASDAAKPIYGVISVSGKTVAHDDTNQVVITDIKATQVDFSTLDRKELTDLALEVRKLMPTGPITVSQERLADSLPTSTSRPAPTGGIVVLGRSFPNETNTGVPDDLKSSLTPYTGSCTITAADVKIDRKVITCDQLRLLGPNTAITNSIIIGTVHSDCCYLNGSYSLTDSEVRGPDSTATVVGEARFKLLRVEVSGGSRSVNCNTTCEIRDSYIHGQYGDKRGIDHESGIRQDAHGTFVHNTISCDAIAYPNPTGGEGSGCSAAVSGYGDFGTVNNNTFTDNLIESREGLTGQAASSYCVYGGSTTGKPYPNAHHIVFTDNIFRRGGMGKCGIYGPVTSFDSNAEGSLWQSNVWDDGATVPPAN